MSYGAAALAVLALLIFLPARAGATEANPETATEPTNSGNELRDGWYPEESALNEQLLSSGTFGQEWSTSVEGQVYGQPLLYQGTLFVATEDNYVYGLNPATGAKLWQLKLAGTPWNPAEIDCGDLTPSVGVTATPVIDQSTGIAYLTYKSYVSGSSGEVRWQMDAVEVKTGKQVAGFPVTLSGAAQNDPRESFVPKDQLQRPGLLLLEGAVYAAFGSDCDYGSYAGWVFGVTTSGQIRSRWSTEGEEDGEEGAGAGIWQSGAGLTSDGPRTILLATGNGEDPSPPILGSKPPAWLGESVVRLHVQENGELQPVDFFTPYDAQSLNTWDADFGSGGVTGLPDPYFGTTAIPKLAVVVGKDGYVYLLNREDLGGYGEGAAGEDAVVQRLGPYGGVWSRPGVWPGEGGWVYIPTASGGNSATGSSGNLDIYKYGTSGKGEPALSLVSTSSEAFGFSSSAPVITSNGTEHGSALVWMVWSPNGSGVGAQLRAYAPVPVDGQPVLLWSAPVGTSSKFALPGVGLGRLYVGTRDGHVLGFGSPVTPVLKGSGVEFPVTVVGESSAPKTLTLTATEALTITELTTSSSQFQRGQPSIALPAKLGAGQSIEVPVTFSPAETGPQAATLRATTSSGKSVSFSLAGEGQTSQAKLEADPTIVTLGGTAVGETLSGTARFRNVGAGSLKITHVEDPEPPFYAEAVTVTTLEPGQELAIPISFKPTAVGSFEGTITLKTTAGEAAVHMTGTAALPPNLSISSESIAYGEVPIGQEATQTFKLTNTGGLPLEITISKPPIANEFHATTELAEGTVIEPGKSLTESVAFRPTEAGALADRWRIAAKDGTGVHEVHFEGTGVKSLEGKLEALTATVSLGTAAIGQTLTGDARFRNSGGAPLQIASLEGPQAPFQAQPPTATEIQPGHELALPVSFKPTETGHFEAALTLKTNVGDGTVHLTGTGVPPPTLSISTDDIDYGEVSLSQEAIKTFEVTNTGGLPLEITTSNPPAGGQFNATTELKPGTVIQPGEALVETVAFRPTQAGPLADRWQIEGNDAGGPHEVRLEGTGAAAPQQKPGEEPNNLISPLPGAGTLGFQDATPPTPAAELAALTVTANSSGQILLRVDCPKGVTTCSGTVTLRSVWEVPLASPRRLAVVTLAHAAFSVREGGQDHVRLRLSALGRALLRRHGKLPVRAVVIARDPAGASHKLHQLLTVSPAR